jgi:hypothetical protein
LLAVEPEVFEFEGAVSGLTGECPRLTFSVNGKRLVTDGETTYTGGSCAQVANGRRVEGRGVRTGDGPYRVTRLALLAVEPEVIEVEGSVRALEGSCPSLRFTVGSIRVWTQAATVFDEGTCQQVTGERRVYARGTREGDGPLNATKVILLGGN